MIRKRSRPSHTHASAPCWFAAGVIRYFQKFYGIEPSSAVAGIATDCGGPVVLMKLDPPTGIPRLVECHSCPNAADPLAISVHDVTKARNPVGELVSTDVHEDMSFARLKLAKEIEVNDYRYQRKTREPT